MGSAVWLEWKFLSKNLELISFFPIFATEMNKKNLDIGYFLSFCIEQYKEAKHLSGSEVARIFSRYGVLEYLEEHFEPLHSQSCQWILEDIDEFIGLRKGDVA